MKIIQTVGLEIKSWCEDPEEGAIEQARHLAQLPFIHQWVALMPDTHQGYGMPIGAVLPTKDVIIPNAVGVDIGCGMCAVKTSLTEIDKEVLKKIMGSIRGSVPVGFKMHEQNQGVELVNVEHTDVITPLLEKAGKQVGTLGGGNHFIEIQKGSDGFIWIMIHSGSRNLGKTVADHYNKLAIKLNKKWWSLIPEEWELAFLPVDSQEGKDYIKDMNYCIDFAFKNRRLMLDNIQKAFTENLEVFFDKEINIAHNYARIEHHMGKDIWVHRKGATSARLDEIGIIPGSQGTKSYIVKGKGNIMSFQSCSHGSGRRMGRNQAKRELNLEEEVKRLDELGVIHSIRSTKELDEAPGAYKDIQTVMAEQTDLVDVVVELSPLAVIKG